MAEYIEKAELYNEISRMEELARKRYLDTLFNSPASVRYQAQAQLQERTALKHLIADTKAADVAPVKYGRIIKTRKHFWKKDEYGRPDDFAYSAEYCNGPVCQICGYSFCVHCDERAKKSHPEKFISGWDREDCYEHLVCSECGRPIFKDDLYCNCGAKMIDGGGQNVAE